MQTLKVTIKPTTEKGTNNTILIVAAAGIGIAAIVGLAAASSKSKSQK